MEEQELVAQETKKVAKVLSELYRNRERVRLFYGSQVSGRDWGEEAHVLGYVRRTTGPKKSLILIWNKRAWGGILIGKCIIKIVRTSDHRVLYEHPKYHQPTYVLFTRPTHLPQEYTTSVYAGKVNVANFRSFERARRWMDFMTGKRMAP